MTGVRFGDGRAAAVKERPIHDFKGLTRGGRPLSRWKFPPTTEEIRNARLLATVLPQDALTHAMLIAATVGVGIRPDSVNSRPSSPLHLLLQ